MEQDNLILEHLRAIRADIAQLGERMDRVERRLSTIEHHMAGILAAFSNVNDDIDNLRRRIERRLEIVD